MKRICGVTGLPPEAGRLLTCGLSNGHIGYHKSGSTSWLGYWPTPEEVSPSAEARRVSWFRRNKHDVAVQHARTKMFRQGKGGKLIGGDSADE